LRSQQLQHCDSVRREDARRQIVLQIEFIEFADKFRLFDDGQAIDPIIDLVEIPDKEEIAAEHTENDAEDGGALFDDLCHPRASKRAKPGAQ
jgi:hypothetical protein